MNESVRIIGIVVLCIAPLWLFAGSRDTDELLKSLGGATVLVGLGIKALTAKIKDDD